MFSWFKNPVVRFFITAVGLFFLWELIYEGWLHPKGFIDKAVISNLIFLSGTILKILGYSLVAEVPFDENFRTLGIDGGHTIWVGDPCNGLSLFALFAGFIMAFPGKISQKIWYIPAGIIAIHLVNVFRIAALAIVVYYKPEWLNFNHTYTFTILVYSFVFVLWYLWVTKFMGVTLEKLNN